MKIEKINDNQIRCVLNGQDLRERNLKLSEFVYGSDKARELFSDMMRKASRECDFEAEDMPLMIEAIPTSPESLILIITKVDNPEELDTRFSSFTPYHEEEEESEPKQSPFANHMLDQLQQFSNDLLEHLKLARTATDNESALPTDDASVAPQLTIADAKAFLFRRFDNITAYAHAVCRLYDGDSILYRNPSEHSYVLCLIPGESDAISFNKACNIACEYSTALERTSLSFYKEHLDCLIAGDAIAQLARLS